MPVCIRGYAKVNLSLAVLGKRRDGYHELKGVMHGIGLYDELEMEPNMDILVESDVMLPYDNTVRRMAAAYCNLTGASGVKIRLKKHIPSEAGLGGASADAAAVLQGMEQLYGRLSPQDRSRIALSVGADVPFCLAGGTALAQGIGERLTPLRTLKLALVVIKGSRGISTGKLFSGLKPPYLELDHDGMIQAFEEGDLNKIGACMGNGLEEAACSMVPEIASIKNDLLNRGALGACMTGSGAAVIGLFSTSEQAKLAAEAYRSRGYFGYWE